MGKIELIRFDVFVKVHIHWPAIKKPDIMAESKLKASRIAKKLYGSKSIVIEPYDPYWPENDKNKKHENKTSRKN